MKNSQHLLVNSQDPCEFLALFSLKFPDKFAQPTEFHFKFFQVLHSAADTRGSLDRLLPQLSLHSSFFGTVPWIFFVVVVIMDGTQGLIHVSYQKGQLQSMPWNVQLYQLLRSLFLSFQLSKTSAGVLFRSASIKKMFLDNKLWRLYGLS